MAMKEYLFDARTGFFLVAKPCGFAWGTAELDGRLHIIIQTDNPYFIDHFSDMLAHKFKLTDKWGYSGKHNIWGGGKILPAPAREHISPPVFLKLKNGTKYLAEEAALADCNDEDVFFFSPSPNDPETEGRVLLVATDPGRRLKVVDQCTLKEAEKWLTLK
jgi:hypothetical protein